METPQEFAQVKREGPPSIYATPTVALVRGTVEVDVDSSSPVLVSGEESAARKGREALQVATGTFLKDYRCHLHIGTCSL